MFKKYIAIGMLSLSGVAFAEDVPISGTVQSKCSVYTETQGVYGSPYPYQLSTAASDGGVLPKIRVDTSAAGYYLARITTPDSFSSSPSLPDSVAWTGSSTVDSVGDSNMSVYETNKVVYDNVTEYDLTVAGSVWITASSTATYGVDTSFPAGNYTAIVTAECIAK
jgi:hypothetical protein